MSLENIMESIIKLKYQVAKIKAHARSTPYQNHLGINLSEDLISQPRSIHREEEEKLINFGITNIKENFFNDDLNEYQLNKTKTKVFGK